MRVATKTLYAMSEYRLGKLSEQLNHSNEVIATGNKINNLSDDPIGLTQVLNLKSRITNLTQMDKNIDMGKTWLDGAETSLDSTVDLISEVTTSCNQLINASATLQERTDAIAHVEGVIQRILNLGNVQINGNYVFGGTKTDVPPLVYNDTEDPPNVAYVGDLQPFKIKTTQISSLEVGKVGKSVFWEESVMVDHSNGRIVFTEDTGKGKNYIKTLTADIPTGEYTKADLATVVKNALNAASTSSGFGIDYSVSYDKTTNKYTIEENGDYKGYVKTDFKWETGGDARLDKLASGNGISLDDVNLDFAIPESLTIGSPEPSGTDPFTLTWQGNGTWRVSGNPGYKMMDHITGTAKEVKIDLTDDSIPDIILKLDQDAPINGFVEFEMVEDSGNHNIGPDLGFDKGDTSISPLSSDNDVVLLTINSDNNQFDFVETDIVGNSKSLKATFTVGEYKDLSKLAQEIENAMSNVSAAGGYNVSYDENRKQFVITNKEPNLRELKLLWNSNGDTAAILGFDDIDETVSYSVSDTKVRVSIITGANDTIQFKEVNKDGVTSPIKTAKIPQDTYYNFDDLAEAVQVAMNQETEYGIDYDVSFDSNNNRFTIQSEDTNLKELKLLWTTNPVTTATAAKLGFNTSPQRDDTGTVFYGSDNEAPSLMKITTFSAVAPITPGNDKIDFQEIDANGKVSSEMTITLPAKNYCVPSELAEVIEKSLETESAKSGNSVDYTVKYNSDLSRFTIEQNGDKLNGFRLLWGSGTNVANSAGTTLGFSGVVPAVTDDEYINLAKSDHKVELFNINTSNNIIDFKEFKGGTNGVEFCELTAVIPNGNYTSGDDLAAAIEKVMEFESDEAGYKADYTVLWNKENSRFSIKEAGTTLDGLQLLWKTGTNNANNAASVLGFNSDEDDSYVPYESDREVEWGLFNTLLEMKDYLAANDVDGLTRTMTRLEQNYSHVDSVQADNGIKYNRLDILQKISTDVTLTLTSRRSNLQEADYVESIMNLKSSELAYQASLSSTSKILNISLVDYM